MPWLILGGAAAMLFAARVVITPRRDSTGKAIGYLLISKDISAEIRLTEELKATQFYARSLASALEVFLLQLSEGSAKIGPAILRPMAQAIDLAAVLLDKAAASEPDTTAAPKILGVESKTSSTEKICDALAHAGLAVERLDTDGAASGLLAQKHFDFHRPGNAGTGWLFGLHQ